MSEKPLVELRRAGATCVIVLRREAKLNALSTAMEGELAVASSAPRSATPAASCSRAAGGSSRPAPT